MQIKRARDRRPVECVLREVDAVELARRGECRTWNLDVAGDQLKAEAAVQVDRCPVGAAHELPDLGSPLLKPSKPGNGQLPSDAMPSDLRVDHQSEQVPPVRDR